LQGTGAWLLNKARQIPLNSHYSAQESQFSRQTLISTRPRQVRCWYRWWGGYTARGSYKTAFCSNWYRTSIPWPCTVPELCRNLISNCKTDRFCRHFATPVFDERYFLCH